VFFSVIGAVLALISLSFGGSLLVEFFQTGLVPRLPTALLATGLMMIAALSVMTGLILDTVTRGRWEAKRMAYLSLPGPEELTLS
jgi:hypothetical protein